MTLTNEDSEVFGLAMVLIDGTQLRKRIDSRWQKLVLESLDYLHNCSVLWADVHETNVVGDCMAHSFARKSNL